MTPVASHAAAVARARAALAGTDLVRLVDDAADGCPGLVIDRYGPVLRLELRGAQWPADIDDVARSVADAVRAPHAVGLLRTAAGASTLRVLLGDPATTHVVHEAGARLLVRTADADAAGTGAFVDHRAGRALVTARARGGTVLNLFAHAGAFGAAAVVGGAARVDHVDAAKKCAPWAAQNIALNGDDPRKHRFLVEDALAFAARCARKGPAYDIVICDPPTTALRPGGARFHVEKDLGALAADCLTALLPGGLLVLSTNDRAVSVDDVARVAREAATTAQRSLKAIAEIPLGADLPSASDPALRPMRGVAVTLA